MKAHSCGLMAEFLTSEELVNAARATTERGFRRFDAYSPFDVEGLAQAMKLQGTRVPRFTLVGGIIGAFSGYFMEWYAAVISYPLNIGGRALNAIPAFIPVAFEMGILGAALGALLSWLILDRFMTYYHPVFNVPQFVRASTDRFFIAIFADDPLYAQAREFLLSLQPRGVYDIEP